MKKIMMLGAVLMAGWSLSAWPDDSGGLISLRDAPLNEVRTAAEMKDFPKENPSVGLSYSHQPPLVSHQIRNYQVDRRVNKCLSCHSLNNYQRYGATKISTSHYEDRQGNVLADISPRRYFCLQCHVPQMNARPLVENIHAPAGSLAN